MKKLAIFLLLALPGFVLQAQIEIFTVRAVPILNSGDTMKYAWVGGLNSPHFSSFNLDNDGFDDLYVFDRSADKPLTFINRGSANSIDYEHAPFWENQFPRMIAWSLGRDYNCDGETDIFAHVNTGIQVIRTQRSNNSLIFQVVDSIIRYPTIPPFTVNIWVARDDIPAVEDVDGDGDLDILTFSLFGNNLEYYRNLSQDNGHGCDSLQYRFEQACWGNFAEAAFTNDVILGTCKGGQINSGTTRHSGSTVTAFDDHGDIDLDLILGDISFPNLVYLANGGDSSWANMVYKDTTYPKLDKPTNVMTFPIASIVDINNDGKNDMISSPNGIQASFNHGNIWLYLNTSNTDSAEFTHQTDSFLVNDMLDFGEGAYPVFFDHNNDSLLDVIVGNFGYFTNGSTDESKLAYLKNVGTAAQPAFELVSRDYQGLSNLLIDDMHPAFGDLNGDGHDDMILGELDGFVHLLLNTPGPGGVANFSLTTPNYFNIDVGKSAAPIVYDLNDDGLNDLVIGNELGKVEYYWNFGTTNSPQFHKDSVNEFLGEINTNPGFLINYARPMISAIDSTGEEFLFVGTERGFIQQYRIATDSLRNGSFELINPKFGNLFPGRRSSIAIADLNNDTVMEMLLGNIRGGLTLFSLNDALDTLRNPVDTTTPVSTSPNTKETNFAVYPNPASDVVRIQAEGIENSTIEVFNAVGQRVWAIEPMDAAVDINVDISNWSEGLYVVYLTSVNETSVRKFVKQ